jgi:serine/threonine-protein kinase RsbW
LIRPQPPEDRAPGAPRDVEVRVVPVPEALVTVRTVAGDLAARAEFPLDSVDDLRLAVDEACTCLAALARPGTKLTVTFAVDDERITMTASVLTTGPTTLPTDTFAWRVLSVLADDVRVLAEAPSSAGEAHRLALRVIVERTTEVPLEDVLPDTGAAEPAGEPAAVALLADRRSRSAGP